MSPRDFSALWRFCTQRVAPSPTLWLIIFFCLEFSRTSKPSDHSGHILRSLCKMVHSFLSLLPVKLSFPRLISREQVSPGLFCLLALYQMGQIFLSTSYCCLCISLEEVCPDTPNSFSACPVHTLYLLPLGISQGQELCLW